MLTVPVATFPENSSIRFLLPRRRRCTTSQDSPPLLPSGIDTRALEITMPARRLTFLPLALVALLAWAPLARTEPAAPPTRPRLAVLLVIDQLRGDFLMRWGPLFGKGGFQRLQQEGAWFVDCHYPYAVTYTAPGHASFLTGCNPSKHGVIGNEWYDRAAATSVYCVESDRHERVPPVPPPKGKTETPQKDRGGMSPDRLLVESLGDVLKQATGGKARVVSLSHKDRSAILPAGRQPDACYWLDSSAGGFVTSTCYRDRLHPWVAKFNADKVADHWFGKEWARLHPTLDYDRQAGPDDFPGEGLGIDKSQGRTFPHPLTGGLAAPGKNYYEALVNSPFGNDLLLELTKRAIDAERLGADDVPDLLCLSFSSNDYVGHFWGPDSHEVLDVTLRTDLILRDLLHYLDDKVGKGQYVVALSADHGVCPLPEMSLARGREALRIEPKMMDRRIAEFLFETYGKGDEKGFWLEATDYPWIYLNQRLIRDKGLDLAQVERALAKWLARQPGVQTAYTRQQLAHKLPTDDVIGARLQLSYHAERSGNVGLVLKPLTILWKYPDGTTHSSPHGYDTHAPLLVYGPGIPGGVRKEPVTPQAIAAIFARLLGIRPPAAAEYPVPETLYEAP
jgi:hypothetical protein